MVNTRTYVRLLRHLGIALIFAPEPFTTPFGVAFILVSRHLSKRHQANVNNRLRQTVQYYLAHSSLLNNDADGKSCSPGPVKRHGLKEEPPILGQITGSNIEAIADSSVWQNWHDRRRRTIGHTADMQSPFPHYKPDDGSKIESGRADTSRRGEKVIHHTMDIERLSRHYETGNRPVARSSRDRISGSGEGVATYHSVNMKSPSQHHKTDNVERTRAKPHAISTVQLRRRYGSTVSHTSVRSELQSNNRYYDLLFKGNVIGG